MEMVLKNAANCRVVLHIREARRIYNNQELNIACVWIEFQNIMIIVCKRIILKCVKNAQPRFQIHATLVYYTSTGRQLLIVVPLFNEFSPRQNYSPPGPPPQLLHHMDGTDSIHLLV